MLRLRLNVIIKYAAYLLLMFSVLLGVALVMASPSSPPSADGSLASHQTKNSLTKPNHTTKAHLNEADTTKN